MFIGEALKSVPLAELERIIAKAISDRTGLKAECCVLKLDYSDVGLVTFELQVLEALANFAPQE